MDGRRVGGVSESTILAVGNILQPDQEVLTEVGKCYLAEALFT